MNNLLLKLLLLLLPLVAYTQKADELIDIKFLQFKNEQKSYLAIQLNLEKGWHVYWKNPGDSGIATDWKFTSSKNSLLINMLEWPAPKLYKEAGDLWTFGYSAQQYFFAEVTQNNSKNDDLVLVSEFLVCKELCIPAKFTFNFETANGVIQIPNELKIKVKENELISKLALLPKNSELDPNWSWNLYHLENSTKLRIVFKLPNSTVVTGDQHLLSAFPSVPFNFRHFNLSKNQFLMEIDWDGQYQDPAISLPTDGKFSKDYHLKFLWHKANNSASIINLQISKFQTLNINEWNSLENSNASTTSEKAVNANFFLMILFALLGGFILNFMPCVLPIISLKLYSLIHHTQKSKSALVKHHASYTFGVVLSFWVIAGIIIIIKQSGESIGWGFQLQSPTFVWLMILLFFILSLNLFGLFELKTPGGKFISNIRSQHPYIDDFLAGLLAVIVATPCSAPFLGPALTYAFSQNPLIILMMFSAMGIGLSLPFILTALVPASLGFLPKPGAWMNTFKFLMGLALLITCIWLLEVLQHLIDFPNFSFLIFLVLTLIFFSLFIYQKEKKLSPLVIFMICFTFFYTYRSINLINTYSSTDLSQVKTTLDNWQPWNETNIQELLDKQIPFFIDATAKWCITCQVNKKLVFETNDFKEFVNRTQLTTIRLDWTKKDPDMFNWMQKNGAVSVPAYFLGINGKILFLGETISISKIENALQNP